MLKVLIAIVSCNREEWRRRVKAQRATWARPDSRADIRYFYGRGWEGERTSDEIYLDVPDDYNSLVAKTLAVFAWALERGYDFVFKTDDDVYVSVDRLLASGFEQYDYSGRLRGASGKVPAAYCSGLGYWISRRAMEIVVAADPGKEIAEDRFVGNALYSRGIIGRADYRYAVTHSKDNSVSACEGPRNGNNIIASCEYEPEAMYKVHRAYLHEFATSVPSRASGPLSNIAVMVKTFLRDGYLTKTIEGLRKNLPEVKIVIADDGYHNKSKFSMYAKLRDEGHSTIILPFDVGFGAKANATLPDLDRQYVLIASDDFNFHDKNARIGVERLARVLENDPSITIASGRVNNRAYEHILYVERNTVTERAGYRESRETEGVRYHLCDLTVNYSLIRRSALGEGKLSWDGGEVKIGGGEHGAFFLDAMRAGLKTAFVEGVNINEHISSPFDFHYAYPDYRRRAKQLGRSCLKRRGIDRWQLATGVWEET